MVRLSEGPVRDFRDKLVKQRYSPYTRTSPPEPPPEKSQVVVAFISFLLFVVQIHFSTIHFTIYSFSCFASFVHCLVNVRAEVQAETANHVEQETGNSNLKDQVLQPQRCRSHGSLVQRCKASRPCRYCLALPLAETELCYYSSRIYDNSFTVSDFANDCRLLINLIIRKLNPNGLIIPKTILSANNHLIQ